MEEAAKIQQNLIPDTLPEISGYEATGLYFPRGGVGGDYYDCLPDVNGTWGLAIADVSGKGCKPHCLWRRCGQVALRGHAKGRSAKHGRSTQLTALCEQYRWQFATFFYAQLHPEVDQITSVNAGHNYPLVIRSEGGCDELEKGGVMLGMFPNDVLAQISEYEQETTQLGSGTLCFSTPMG